MKIPKSRPRNPFAAHANARKAGIITSRKDKRIQNQERIELDKRIQEANDERKSIYSSIYDYDDYEW